MGCVNLGKTFLGRELCCVKCHRRDLSDRAVVLLFLPSAPIILTFLYLSPASSTISFLHVITTSCRNRLHSTPDAVSNAVGFCVIFNSHVKNETRKDVFKKEGRSFKVRDGCGGWGVKCILLSFCSPPKFHYRISLRSHAGRISYL